MSELYRIVLVSTGQTIRTGLTKAEARSWKSRNFNEGKYAVELDLENSESSNVSGRPDPYSAKDRAEIDSWRRR